MNPLLAKWLAIGVFAGVVALAVLLHINGVRNLEQQLANSKLALATEQENVKDRDEALQYKQREIEEFEASKRDLEETQKELQQALRSALAEQDHLRKMFNEHNFSDLVNKKPGLIQNRMREAGKKQWESIEALSK